MRATIMNDDIWVHFGKIPELKNDEILLAQVNIEKITQQGAMSIFQTLKSALPDKQILMIPDEITIKKFNKDELLALINSLKDNLWELSLNKKLEEE